MLGIDSSFSAIEATSTVICDTAWGGRVPRMFVAFVLCAIGFLGSIPFCFNFGFTLFDTVDHYLCAYLLNIIGVIQSFGCGWFFDADRTILISDGHKKSLYILGISYWILLVVIGTPCVVVEGALKIGIALFLGLFCCVATPASFFVSGLGVREWYNDIFMCGVRKIAYSCSQMGRKYPN